MSKFKPVFITIGIYLFIGLFIVYSLNKATLNVPTKEERDVDEDLETHPVRTYLIIDNGFSKIEYYARLEDSDSLSYLFEYHRENSGLTYEKTNYIYGTSIEAVNGIYSTQGYAWKVYDNDKDITFDIDGKRLQTDHIYLIRLEQE